VSSEGHVLSLLSVEVDWLAVAVEHGQVFCWKEFEQDFIVRQTRQISERIFCDFIDLRLNDVKALDSDSFSLNIS